MRSIRSPRLETRPPLAGGPAIRFRSVRSRNADCHVTDTSTKCGEHTTVYDGRGRVYRALDYDRSGTDVGASGVVRATTIWHNPLGWVTGVRDPRGVEWAYEYDPHGNRIRSDDPDLGVWMMKYDEANNLTRQTDAKGQVITFTYDLLDRQKTKVAGGVTITSTYDTARSGYSNIGRLTRLSNGSSHVVSYDCAALGGLAKEVHQVDGRSYAIETSFKPNGLISGIKLPANASGTANDWVGGYTYDPANRPVSFGAAVSAIEYDLRDNPTRLTYANGTVETRSHSAARGWFTGVEVRKGTDLRLNTQLTRSASGLITRQYTANPFGRFDHVYDYAARLRSSTNFGGKPAYDQTFTYDAAGSIRSKTGIGAYVYPGVSAAHPHAPSTVGGAAFTYDANGNMTTGLGGKVMTYDAENRVKTAQLGGVTMTYVHGADGARLKAGGGGSTTLTIGPIEVQGYGSGSETLILYPAPWFRTTGGVTSVLHRDQVDSIQAIAGGGGGLVKETTYQPFGEARDAAVATPISPTETHGYIGERFDAVPGLQYLNARYYDPKLSLFTSPDWFEVTIPGVGTNRYAYAGNSPLNTSNPSGNLFNDTALSRGWDSIFGGGSWDSTTIGRMGSGDLGHATTMGAAGTLVGSQAGVAGGAALGAATGGVTAVATVPGGSIGGAAVGGGLGFGLGFILDTIEEFTNENVVSSVNSDGNFTTPAGNEVRNHGKKGNGQDYLDQKDYTGETVDSILGGPVDSYPTNQGDSSIGGKESVTVHVGQNGDWVAVNDKTGKVIQVYDRNNPR